MTTDVAPALPRGKRRDIDITLYFPGKPRRKLQTKKVAATVYGPLALHHSDEGGGRWHITHLETGSVVLYAYRQAQARRIVARLLAEVTQYAENPDWRPGDKGLVKPTQELRASIMGMYEDGTFYR